MAGQGNTYAGVQKLKLGCHSFIVALSQPRKGYALTQWICPKSMRNLMVVLSCEALELASSVIQMAWSVERNI